MAYQHQYTDGSTIHFPLNKVVCIGRNYVEHAHELNNPIPTEPLLFIKPASAVVSHRHGFVIPKHLGAVHYEVEIALLIGKPLSGKASDQEIKAAITGIAPALDLTLRDVQSSLKEQGYPWEKAKAFDGACILADFLPASTYPDLTDIDICLKINGEIRQQGNSSQMITPIIPMIQQIIEFFSLQPGDVVLTGTPKGVGALSVGDTLEMSLPPHVSFTTEVR